MTWAALETALDEAPLFFIEPRDKLGLSENDRQHAFVKAVRSNGLHVVAILNGEKRGQWALNLARKLGAWWGFPDCIVFGPRRFVAVIEFKDGTSKPDQRQIDCMNVLHRLGFPVAVFRTAGAAMAWVVSERRRHV